MKRLLPCAAIMTALLAPGAGRAQIQTQAPSDATPTTVVVQGQKGTRRPAVWFRAESRHFIVYSDTRREDVTRLLNALEKFRYVLRSYLREDTIQDDAEPKTEITYLAHAQDLALIRPDGPDYAIGLYSACADADIGVGVYMYADQSRSLPLEKQPDNEGLGYMLEAYARHYSYQHSDLRQPTWFIDGFAHYFSTVRFDGNEAIVGMAPAAFARYFNLIGNVTTYSLDYRDVLQQKEDNGRNAAGPSGVRNEYQARAWLLTHYILSSPDNRRRFAAYLSETAAGQSPVAAWKAAFGMTPGQLDNALWRYRLHDLQALKLVFKALPDADISFQSLPASAQSVELWRTALRTCPSVAYGRVLLTRLRAEAPRFPDSDLAQLSLARAEIAWGDPNAALPYLTKVTKGASTDAEAFTLLGRAHIALAMSSSGSARRTQLDQALSALGRASVFDPGSPETGWWFYRAVALGGRMSEDGAAAILTAWKTAPDVDLYALHAGLALAWLGRKDEALEALRTVADNPRDPALAATAQVWIDRLGAGMDKDALVDAMGMQASDPDQMQWTLASADIVAAVKAAADAQDANDAMSTADPQSDQDSQLPGN